ncbi:MAG: 2-oxo acid dehydrogenase subunit E2, partial [Gammaproteobacteria bacterium]|nr:2-oxo acid dehydrogenase subunit E2 [Gammaproteobacteria bacterium]
MTRHVMRLPDLGEGTVSAEVIAWKVKPGDVVREDSPLVEMSTDKAVVEVPSPVTGQVISITGNPGDVIAVGAELVVFEIEAKTASSAVSVPAAPAATTTNAKATAQTSSADSPKASVAVSAKVSASGAAVSSDRVMASPATRRRAFEAGIDLATVSGSGP